MNLTNAGLRNNKANHRFELETEGKRSIIVYKKVDDETLALLHTEVDPSLEGKGVGSHLVEETLTYVEQNNLKIVPLCPFVAVYLKRHPAWNRVVSTAYSVEDF